MAINNQLYVSNNSGASLINSTIMNQAYVPHVFEGLGNLAEMEKALEELARRGSFNQKNSFFSITAEDAIEAAGHIEPVEHGLPTAMANALLERCPLAKSAHRSSAYSASGLFYAIPAMFNRSLAFQTSFVGLALLDHWAEKCPRFRPYVDAYAPDWVRERITSDCFDLGLGQMPGWIKEKMEESAKLEARYTKAKERQYLKEEYARRMTNKQNMLNQQNILVGQSPPPASGISWVSNTLSTLGTGLLRR